MPIDAYSVCPGGTGKKIKFCCPDLLPELQKIERMLEGQQHVGCLKHIEQLDQKQPGRPCLMAIKSMLERVGGQLEAAQQTTATFLAAHPDNPVALAESAILAALSGEGRQAMEKLQRAIVAGGTEISSRLYDAIEAVAQTMLAEGQFLAARALLLLQATISEEDREAVQMVGQLNRSPSVPLLMRDDRALDRCPEDVPWKADFDAALADVNVAQWSAAADKLAALAEQVPDAAVIWRNLAVLRSWLADTPAAIEALRKFAALDVPAEDAVEAEALALCLSDDPLGDEQDTWSWNFTVDNIEAVQTAFSASPRVVLSPMDPRTVVGEGDPPPKSIHLLLDRPAVPAGEIPTLDTMPDILCLLALFGRQTDREARLEVLRVVQREADTVLAAVEEWVGNGLRPDPVRKVDGRISVSWHLMSPRPWAANETPMDQLFELIDQRRAETLLANWPVLPLGLLEGKSPAEVDGDPSARRRLAAAVMVLELWSSRNGEPLDLNPLRSRLNLPVAGPIDPAEVRVQTLPLVRLARVEVEKLSDEELLQAYRRASVFGAAEARTALAGQLIARATMVGRPERLMAYSVLARAERDPEKMLQHVEAGRTEAEAAGQSSASWDLLELSFRFEQGDGQGAMQLLRHVEREHIREPGVGEALTQMLVQYGLIRPDGTPALPPDAMPPGAEPPGPEPGKLWTPDSQKPAEEKKLWMPGMD